MTDDPSSNSVRQVLVSNDDGPSLGDVKPSLDVTVSVDFMLTGLSPEGNSFMFAGSVPKRQQPQRPGAVMSAFATIFTATALVCGTIAILFGYMFLN